MIGKKIKSYLTASGKTVNDLARLWGIGRVQVQNIFNKDVIETDKLCAFSKWLNIPIQNFFDETEAVLVNENQTNLTLNEPQTPYEKESELTALRELVRTQKELIEVLKTAGSTAKNQKTPISST